jgi:predicted nucleic acid-binding protein
LIEYVFLEVVTVLLARRGHRAALDVADILLDAEEVDFLPCSDLFRAALREFRTRSAARLSFADAAIVAAAQRHGAEFIATFDEGFRGIEGITMIPAKGSRSTPTR